MTTSSYKNRKIELTDVIEGLKNWGNLLKEFITRKLFIFIKKYIPQNIIQSSLKFYMKFKGSSLK